MCVVCDREKSATARKWYERGRRLAPFLSFPNGVQVELVFVLDSQIISNRLWFYTAGDPPTTSDLVGLADGVYDWYTTLILPGLSVDLLLATVVATDWTSPGAVGEVTTGPPITGSVAEQSHSANVAVVVPFRWPNYLNRRRKNKNYVAGIPLSGIQFNHPTPETTSLLFEGYAALIDAARTFAPGDYWYWVVTSMYEGGSLRSEMAFGLSIGIQPGLAMKVGQRRKRLPLS